MPVKFIQKSTKPVLQAAGSLSIPSNVAEIGVDSSLTPMRLVFNPNGTPLYVSATDNVTDINSQPEVSVLNLAGATWHTGNGAADYLSWANPASGTIVVSRVLIVTTTKSTGAATADIGTATASKITSADTLLDGLDIGTAAGTFDNFTNHGTNGLNMGTLASGKWVTFHALADPTGLVGKAYIFWFRV